MHFTVEYLMNSEVGQSMVLCAGESGIHRCISGATIIEAPDIVHFINGGEILLTGLYAFAECSVEEFAGYIAELKNKGVGGIVLKPGRKVRDADTKIAMLTEYARVHEIPLMTLPFEVSFQVVLMVIMEHLVSEEVTQLKYYKTTRDNFNALTMGAGSSGQRIEAILHMLDQLIGNPVALYRSNMVCAADTEGFRRDFHILPEAEPYETSIFTSFRYFRQAPEGVEQVLVRMELDNKDEMILAADCSRSEFNAMSCIAMENACLALKGEWSRMQAVEEVQKRFQSDMLSGILYGTDMSAEECRKNAALIGMNIDGNYRVLAVSLRREAWEQRKMDGRISAMNLLEEMIRQARPEDRICREQDRILVVREETGDIAQQVYRSGLRTMLEELQKAISRRDRTIRLQMGAGKQVHGVEHIAPSCREACDAIAFVDVAGDAVGDIIADGNAHLVMSSDLGVFRLLSQITDTEELQTYIPESLQKLYGVRKSQRDELAETLKTYLDCSQNLSQTSRKLYIHYKTAAYRIDKIAEITGMDFENAGEMLAVRVGLVVHQMIENIRGKNGQE